jgi:hypothetical protein
LVGWLAGWPAGWPAGWLVDAKQQQRTIWVWPMRWHLAWACASFCGFQSESKITTVSAAVRLMPTPPARVLSKNTKLFESGWQKRSMASCRRFPRIDPSMRS